MFRPVALKSVVVPRSIQTVLSLANDGTTGAITGEGAMIVDLRSTNGGGLVSGDIYGISDYHEGLFKLEAKSVNGQGATPTSPGASKTYTLYYAFLDDSDVALADAPTILANVDQSLSIALPDSNSSAAAGTRYHATDLFVCAGRYLYLWYDRTAFASADALVDLTVKLIRL
jgi:hypothetical protein